MPERETRPPPRGPISLVLVLLLLVLVAVWTRAESEPSVAPTTLDFAPRTTSTEATTTTEPIETTTTTTGVLFDQDFDGPGWTKEDPGWLPPNVGYTTLLADNRFVVFGGGPAPEDDRSSSKFYRFGSWANIAPAPITPTQNPVAVWTGREVFAYTGAAAAWDPGSNTWRSLAYPPTGTSAPGAHPLAGTWTGTEVILIGYRTHPPVFEDNLFVASYGPDLGCCRTYPDPPFSASFAEIAWTGDRVLLLGTLLDVEAEIASTDDVPRLASFASFDPAAETWTTVPSPPLDHPEQLASTWTGLYFYVMDAASNAARWSESGGWESLPALPIASGGCTRDLTSTTEAVYAYACGEVARWDGASQRWTRLVVPEPSSGFPEDGCRLEPDAREVDGVLLWCSDGTETSFWTLDGNAWEAARWSYAMSGAPWEVLPNPAVDRYDSTTLVWSGEELIWFAGHGIEEENYGGAGYDPINNVLHRIGTAPYPGRFGQVAVFTDDEMMIFRGVTSLWNPRTQEWREAFNPPNSVGSPAPMWTGQEVILFGSSDQPSSFSAAYNPDTDTWRSLPPAPDRALVRPPIGWSGSQMYTLRGPSHTGDATRGLLGSRTQRGAAYDPEDDGWTTLPELPDDLNLTGAVGDWVGDEFVVLGANWEQWDHSGELADQPDIAGVAYSPTRGTWRRITDPPQPVWAGEGLAGSMAAVAHGKELAVLFPSEYFGDTASVGLYDPERDQWTVIDGAPASAYATTMVSTGESLAFLTPEGTVLLHVL